MNDLELQEYLEDEFFYDLDRQGFGGYLKNYEIELELGDEFMFSDDTVKIEYRKVDSFHTLFLRVEEEDSIFAERAYQLYKYETDEDLISETRRILMDYSNYFKDTGEWVGKIFDEQFYRFEDRIRDDLTNKRLKLSEDYDFFPDSDYFYIYAQRMEVYCHIHHSHISGKPFTCEHSPNYIPFALTLCEILTHYGCDDEIICQAIEDYDKKPDEASIQRKISYKKMFSQIEEQDKVFSKLVDVKYDNRVVHRDQRSVITIPKYQGQSVIICKDDMENALDVETSEMGLKIIDERFKGGKVTVTYDRSEPISYPMFKNPRKTVKRSKILKKRKLDKLNKKRNR